MSKKLKTLGPYQKVQQKRNYWMYFYAIAAAIFGGAFIGEALNFSWWALFFLIVTAFMVAFTDREYQISKGAW